MPRALKSREQQKERTKSKAEVFTPTWIIKKQNDALEQDYLNDDVETYVRRKWLEISCGEAPYMATRYDMATGQTIPLAERVGFVDRKLKRINADIDDKAEWQRLVEEATKQAMALNGMATRCYSHAKTCFTLTKITILLSGNNNPQTAY